MRNERPVRRIFVVVWEVVVVVVFRDGLTSCSRSSINDLDMKDTEEKRIDEQKTHTWTRNIINDYCVFLPIAH